MPLAFCKVSLTLINAHGHVWCYARPFPHRDEAGSQNRPGPHAMGFRALGCQEGAQVDHSAFRTVVCDT